MTEFLSFTPSTVIFAILNLLLIVWFFKHFLFARVNKILEDRQNQIDSSLDEAELAKQNAAMLEQEYSEKMAVAKEQAAEIVKDATKKAQKRSDEIITDARNEANAVMVKAIDEIEREKKRAVNQMKDEISEIAFMVASKVVDRELTQNDNDRLIEEFINNVGEL